MITKISSSIMGGLITKKYMTNRGLCTFEKYLEKGKTRFRRATFEDFDGSGKLISEMFSNNGNKVSRYRKEWIA